MGPIIKNVGNRSMEKNSRPVSLLLFEKAVNNRLVDNLKKMWPFFLIFSMVSGLLVQLQIF